MLMGIAAFGILAGCQPEKKAIAVVNGKPILEEEYNTRVQGITAGSFQQGVTMDAGGITMLNLIRSELTEQLAAQSNATPTKEFIDSGVDYAVHNDPNLATQLQTGENSKENLARQLRFQTEMIGIGTNGAKISDTELKAAYEGADFAPYVVSKAKYSIKALRVPDMTQGTQILAELKKTADFKKAALSMKANEAQAEAVAKPVSMPADSTPPELKAELDKLKPNEFAPTPIKVTGTNAQGAPGDTFIVAQLIRKEEDRKQTVNEVKFPLQNALLVKNHPDWQKHYLNLLAEFTSKADIKINLEKYKGLLAEIRTQAKTELQTPVSPGGAAPPAGATTPPPATK